jgi:hypothetical protein
MMKPCSLKILICSFAFLFSAQSQSEIILGPASNAFIEQGSSLPAILTASGVYGAIPSSILWNRFALSPRGAYRAVSRVIVTYSHVSNACDTTRCEPIGFSVAQAKTGLSVAPGFKDQTSGLMFLFETRRLERSKAGRARFPTKYKTTDYIVQVDFVTGRSASFYFDGP